MILVSSGRVIFLICCVAKQFLIFVINENNVGSWLPQLLPFTGQLSALIAIFQYWILISGSFFSRKWSALVFKTKCRFLRLKIILLLVKFYIKKSLCPSVFFVIANEVCRRFFFAFLFKCEQVFSVPALPLISVGDNDGASVRLQLHRFKFFLNFLLFSLTVFLYERTRKAPWIPETNGVVCGGRVKEVVCCDVTFRSPKTAGVLGISLWNVLFGPRQ